MSMKGKPISGARITRHDSNSQDLRRKLFVATNSDDGDIPARQVKAYHVTGSGGAWLGSADGHFHDYAEQFMGIVGFVTFYLQSVDRPEEHQKFVLNPGERLTIPARVAHKAFANGGTVFLGVAEQPYVGPEQDHEYPVDLSNGE